MRRRHVCAVQPDCAPRGHRHAGRGGRQLARRVSLALHQQLQGGRVPAAAAHAGRGGARPLSPTHAACNTMCCRERQAGTGRVSWGTVRAWWRSTILGSCMPCPQVAWREEGSLVFSARISTPYHLLACNELLPIEWYPLRWTAVACTWVPLTGQAAPHPLSDSVQTMGIRHSDLGFRG